MVILYTAPSCTSCRKAKAWLQTHDIDFQEHNLFTEPLSIEKIKQIIGILYFKNTLTNITAML